MNLIIVSSKKKQIIDITDTINSEIGKQEKQNGLCFLFIKHTTAALTTADLDPGTDLDMLDAFEQIIPKLNYRHPHNPTHTPDHIMSSILGASLCIPILQGALDLGTWQRIVIVELDGPRQRKIVVQLI
jgi:secondary thiamine-phosphate synthase enzyme